MDVNIKEINKISGDQSILKNCFNSFILPCFEYCFLAWSSAIDFHLKLLDKNLNAIKFFILDLVCTNLWHRCSISSLYSHEQETCRLFHDIMKEKILIIHRCSDFRYNDCLHTSVNGCQTYLHLKFLALWI